MCFSLLLAGITKVETINRSDSKNIYCKISELTEEPIEKFAFKVGHFDYRVLVGKRTFLYMDYLSVYLQHEDSFYESHEKVRDWFKNIRSNELSIFNNKKADFTLKSSYTKSSAKYVGSSCYKLLRRVKSCVGSRIDTFLLHFVVNWVEINTVLKRV